jgi:putative membrane protein
MSPLVRHWLPNAIRGMCMGAADVVPGVSGGTIALVLGIYERLVETIHLGASAGGNLLRGDARAARERLAEIRWGFIIPLFAGVAFAVLTLAHVIEILLEDHPVEIGAVFFGLVAASVWVALGYFKRPDVRLLPIIIVSAVATFLLLGLRTGDISDPGLLVVFGSGALAICAMILPGVSGSFILLMIGMYEYMLDALNERDLAVAGVFILGAIIGLALFSSALDWLLHHFHDIVLAALIGLMVGSLRVLWPWPEGTENTALAAPPAGEWVMPLLLALVAAAVVVAVGLVARRRPH